MPTLPPTARFLLAAFALAWPVRGSALAAAAHPLAAPPTTPEEFFDAVGATYRSWPLAERVSVRLRAENADTARSGFTFRLDASNRGEPRARLDLGDLQVFISGRSLVAANRLEPAACYRAEAEVPFNPALLSKHLPPVALPGWVLAHRQPGEPIPPLTPYAGPMTWDSPEVAPAGDGLSRRGEWTITGRGPDATMTVTVDAATTRLRRIVIDAAPGRRTRSLELAIVPMIPGDSARWAIATEGRRAVDSLPELRPTRGVLTVGSAVPNLLLLDNEMIPWSLADVFVVPGAIDAAALVMFRPAGAEENAAERDARAGMDAALRAAADAEGGPVRLAAYAVAAYDLGRFDREGLDAITARWLPPGDDPARAVLWSSSSRTSIDAFSPGASAVLVLVSRDMKLMGVLPLDGRGADPEALRTAIAALLCPRR